MGKVDPVVGLSKIDAALDELGSLATTGGSTAELLQQAVAATQQLPAAAGAGLMLIDPEHALRYVTASDRNGRLLETSQEEANQGPCVESFVRDAVISTTDLHVDPRWPRLAPLVRESPVRAVLGVPIHLGGAAVGTLNVHAEHPHEWTGEDVSALGAFAGIVDSLLTSSLAHRRSDRLAQQLQYALDYRVVIERAVGFLMCREGVESVVAFSRLRTAARNDRRKIVDVATEVLAGRPLPIPAPRVR